MKKILLFAVILFTTVSVYAKRDKEKKEKEIKYQYYGGHGCVNLDLELYTDSTFLFVRSNAMPFPHSKKMKGAYLLYDDEIHLYQKKKFHFLIPKLEWKYRETVFRKDADHIYLYDEEDLTPENANFIKDYNTLRLYKPNK